jgi:hypothetical protein
MIALRKIPKAATAAAAGRQGWLFNVTLELRFI